MAAPLTAHPTLADERVLAILSPANVRRLDEVKRCLGAVFPRFDTVAPDSLEHLARTVQRSAETHRIIIAVGGDGTLHQILSAFDPTTQILGLLPGGTGNDFARGLGYKDGMGLEAAARHLSTLKPLAGDLCTVNGIRYHNSAGFGLDTATVKVRETYLKGPLHTNYILAFLVALKNMRPLQLDCSWSDGQGREGQSSGEYFWVLGMNNKDIGGGTRMAPNALVDDGLLDVVLIHAMPKLRMLQLLPKAMKGRHIGEPGIDYLQTRDFICRLPANLDYLAIDGERYWCGEKEVRFHVEPRGLMLLR